MKALRLLRSLTSSSTPFSKSQRPISLFYSAQPQREHSGIRSTSAGGSSSSETETDDVETRDFDSAQFSLPNGKGKKGVVREPNWDRKYRERVEREMFKKGEKKGDEVSEEERKRRVIAMRLMEATLERGDEDVEVEGEEDLGVEVEDQKSLSVGIIGAPNAGKSALTNCMVGTKISGVSRKTNTTTHEGLGVFTKGDTQICFFDTPGLMLKKTGYPSKDSKSRIQSAWRSIDLYDVLIVIFDVHRHLSKPDSRVVRLIERMGSETSTKQKRVLCMNKVDLIEKKKDLLKVAEEFKDLKFDRVFMISGLKGSGVKDLMEYFMEQAVKRLWDEDPYSMSEEVMKNISLEVVRERLLDYVHQEIPYEIDHKLIDWKELRDGSLRIEQHFITNKLSQRKILVGKHGSKIGRIGIEANEELRSIFKREVHLILQVRVQR
ncbi:GTP-binding protein ERG-like protein [Drosera capensis]